MRPGKFAILRGTEVLIRGLSDHNEAVALAEEMSHTNSLDLVVVKVVDVIDGRMNATETNPRHNR
jgi:hypothetical protein